MDTYQTTKEMRYWCHLSFYLLTEQQGSAINDTSMALSVQDHRWTELWSTSILTDEGDGWNKKKYTYQTQMRWTKRIVQSVQVHKPST